MSKNKEVSVKHMRDWRSRERVGPIILRSSVRSWHLAVFFSGKFFFFCASFFSWFYCLYSKCEALWCSGSTTDSKSVNGGSIPSRVRFFFVLLIISRFIYVPLFLPFFYIYMWRFSSVVEHWTCNPRVVGSIPTVASSFFFFFNPKHKFRKTYDRCGSYHKKHLPRGSNPRPQG